MIDFDLSYLGDNDIQASLLRVPCGVRCVSLSFSLRLEGCVSISLQEYKDERSCPSDPHPNYEPASTCRRSPADVPLKSWNRFWLCWGGQDCQQTASHQTQNQVWTWVRAEPRSGLSPPPRPPSLLVSRPTVGLAGPGVRPAGGQTGLSLRHSPPLSLVELRPGFALIGGNHANMQGNNLL